jgi:suppressor for copper-sensitivity B
MQTPLEPRFRMILPFEPEKPVRLSRRALLAGLAALGLPAGATALPWSTGRDAHASAWIKGHHSAVRLLAGPRLANGDWLAGLEMQLDPGFKTYWREPGDAGVPPVFDWNGSVGIDGVEVLWPAPVRFFDPSGHSNGYLTGPLFPLRIRGTQAPRHIALKLDYAVCEKLCIPAQAELAFDWPGTDAGASSHAARIREAMARVPRPLGPDATGALSIMQASLRVEAGMPVLAVTVRHPTGKDVGDLFVEAPAPWIWGLPQQVPGGPDGTVLFEIPNLERAAGSGTVDLVLTAVAPGDAAETRLTIPVAA